MNEQLRSKNTPINIILGILSIIGYLIYTIWHINIALWLGFVCHFILVIRIPKFGPEVEKKN